MSRAPASVLLPLVALLSPIWVHAELVPCRLGTDDGGQVEEALSRIRGSLDPCGESAQITDVLRKLERCTTATYEICSSTEFGRNVFDRPIGSHDQILPRTISWNPELRSELERGCDGDPTKPVLRDPTASLLHELVHAAQDSAGLNPGEFELEAVRIENIYRRAAGLCQRDSYGDDPLPPRMMRICTGGACPCSAPLADPSGGVVQEHASPSLEHSGQVHARAAGRAGDSAPSVPDHRRE